jgi:hypothetical protein
MEAHALAAANPFVPAREHFEQLITELERDDVRRMTQGEVERVLERQGTELLRRLYHAPTWTHGAWGRRPRRWWTPTASRALTPGPPIGAWCTTRAEVAKRQVEQLSTRAAADVDTYYDAQGAAASSEAAETAPILS